MHAKPFQVCKKSWYFDFVVIVKFYKVDIYNMFMIQLQNMGMTMVMYLINKLIN
jgi:hypothetical protein